MSLETKIKLSKRWEGCDDRHDKLQRRGQAITYPQKGETDGEGTPDAHHITQQPNQWPSFPYLRHDTTFMN
jgi:hypothetical protein